MFRFLALVLSLALTFTPAVVGACAAVLCTSTDEQARHHGGHDGHAAPVGGDHTHHAVEHERPSAPPPAHLRGTPDHDCCAGGATLAMAVAVVTSRLDAGALVDHAVTTEYLGLVVTERAQHSPPPRAPGFAPPPISASLILRI